MAAARSSYVLLIIHLLLDLICLCLATRKLHSVLQPNCEMPECGEYHNGTFPNVAYIRADGKNDSLHYIISTISLPTFLVVNTNRDVPNLTINWEELLSGNVSGSIKCDGDIIHSFGAVFTKLYEFNDVDKTADMNHYNTHDNATWTIHDFRNFEWYQMQRLDQPNAIVMFAKEDVTKDRDEFNKSLSFSVFARNSTDRDKMLPHLPYNENITQIEFLLDNFVPYYNMSRFGLEMALFSSGDQHDVPKELNVSRSLDDEHTPGVFQMDNWMTNVPDSQHQGFLQWKPILYTKAKRSRNDGTKVVTYDLQSISDNERDIREFFNQTIMYGFYQDDMFSNSVSIQMMNVSFGLPDDGSYVKTNYSVWTLNIGYGRPPKDYVSTMVIVVISVGLGLPIICMLFGGLFVFCKKYLNKKRAAAGMNSSFPVVK